MLGTLAIAKHCSLLRKFVKCIGKKFYNIGLSWSRRRRRWWLSL